VYAATTYNAEPSRATAKSAAALGRTYGGYRERPPTITPLVLPVPVDALIVDQAGLDREAKIPGVIYVEPVGDPAKRATRPFATAAEWIARLGDAHHQAASTPNSLASAGSRSLDRT
jgi:hypothetical protein